jgi:hypothetical protein
MFFYLASTTEAGVGVAVTNGVAVAVGVGLGVGVGVGRVHPQQQHLSSLPLSQEKVNFLYSVLLTQFGSSQLTPQALEFGLGYMLNEAQLTCPQTTVSEKAFTGISNAKIIKNFKLMRVKKILGATAKDL